MSRTDTRRIFAYFGAADLLTREKEEAGPRGVIAGREGELFPRVTAGWLVSSYLVNEGLIIGDWVDDYWIIDNRNSLR